MFIILKMYHNTHTHMVIMIRKFQYFWYWLTLWPMDYLRKLHVAYRPTLGSYQQHDFSRLSSEKLIFLAKAFAQLEVPQLGDNVYTKYLIFQ